MGIKMETIGEGEGAGKVEGIATTTLAATCLVEVVVVAAVLVAAEEVAAEEGAVVAEAWRSPQAGTGELQFPIHPFTEQNVLVLVCSL